MKTQNCSIWAYLKSFVAALTATIFVSSNALGQPQVTISSVPLTLALQAHPQILIAIGNSQSMDGNLSGAIMAGSGYYVPVELTNSSSPTNYAVPAGFTPPVALSSGGMAPYTASGGICGTTACDNSPSRLNVAKLAIKSIINSYAEVADFGLMTYKTSGVTMYQTSLYVMSNPGGFTFSSTPPSSGEYINNPCYNLGAYGYGPVEIDCNSIKAALDPVRAALLPISPYIVVQSTSDDPNINDVFYSYIDPVTHMASIDSVCMVYGSRSPSTPFPPNYNLTDYNNGNVSVAYQSMINRCAPATGPTNAGYVPYQDETMYIQRGYGFEGSQSPTTGNLVISIAPAGGIISTGGSIVPTTTQLNNYISTFNPPLNPETFVPGTTEIKAAATQSPIYGLMNGAYSYFTTGGGPASNNGCAALRYVVLVTDGLPTEDASGKFWPPAGSISAAQYGMTTSFNADGSLNVAGTNDQALVDAVGMIGQLKAKGIKTFVVGLGAGVDPSVNPQAAASLTAMAIAGGTGNYFAATSPDAVATDMEAVMGAIQAENVSISSAAVNSTGLKQGDQVYQARFTSADSPWMDWTGDLLAYPISASTGLVDTSSPKWSAQALLDARVASGTPRLIATWNLAAASGVPFEWASLSSTQQSALSSNLVLNYLRGDTSLEQRNGGSFRNRSHILGDIVNSGPVYVGAPQGPYISDASYEGFAAAEKNREPMLYVGANDGMLHAFDALTGAEKFAYVPQATAIYYLRLRTLSQSTHNLAHTFFEDATPQVADARFADGSWHTILASGLNSGAKAIFALDVTDPASIADEPTLASKVLWEFTDVNLGYTYSQPTIALTNYPSSPYLVFFGSGYDNGNGHDYLYALDVQHGSRVAALDLCTAVVNPPSGGVCSVGLTNGLSSVVAVNSNGYTDQPVDTVYAGDLQGNLWKIAVSDPNPSNWQVILLFTAKDSSGIPQPITTTPVVSLHPLNPKDQGLVIYFGTGRFLAVTDIYNTNTQSFYAVWDKPGLASSALPLARANLQQQTLTDQTTTVNGVSTPVRLASNNHLDWSSQYGWYVDLPDSGERAVTDPRLANGAVIFTTYVPQLSACSAGGKAWLMALNFQSGGTFPIPELDLNSDQKLDSSDQVNGNNPVGLGLGNVYATSPTILSASLGQANEVKLVTKSSGSIQSVLERGPTQQRGSWWQIF